MSGTVFITGADRGLGFGLTENLLKKGWNVLAGQYLPAWRELRDLQTKHPNKLHLIPLDVGSNEAVRQAAKESAELCPILDMLINNAGVTDPNKEAPISREQDYDLMLQVYSVNSLGPLRMTEAFLPLMAKSKLKRLCYVTSEAGSIEASTRQSWYGYCMSKAALNMGVKNMFNYLRPKGYSFRLYHPGWLQSYLNGSKAVYARLNINEAAKYAVDYFLTKNMDEDSLVLHDCDRQDWPW